MCGAAGWVSVYLLKCWVAITFSKCRAAGWVYVWNCWVAISFGKFGTAEWVSVYV